MRPRQLLFILVFITGTLALVAHAQDVHSTCVEVFHQDPATCVVSHPKILDFSMDERSGVGRGRRSASETDFCSFAILMASQNEASIWVSSAPIAARNTPRSRCSSAHQ